MLCELGDLYQVGSLIVANTRRGVKRRLEINGSEWSVLFAKVRKQGIKINNIYEVVSIHKH